MYKYKDYRIGCHVFTVEMWFGNNGYFDEIHFQIWDCHKQPKGIIQRIVRFWTVPEYGIYTWAGELDDNELEEYIIKKCADAADQLLRKNRTKTEWEKIN